MAFAATGDPGWPAYDGDRRATMRFDDGVAWWTIPTAPCGRWSRFGVGRLASVRADTRLTPVTRRRPAAALTNLVAGGGTRVAGDLLREVARAAPPVASPGMPIDREALIAFTQQLVRIPSVHDPATGRNEGRRAHLVADRMRAFGWVPELVEVASGRPNVIATIAGGQPGPTLLFEGHTDVVTEGDAGTWTVDPFGGEIVDGRLYGRGSADMKSGVAAMLYAAKEVADAGPFPGRIVVAALVDEEGMMLGAKHLVASGGLAGVDGIICCEPEAGEVCNTAKGALRLRVDFAGKMAHGAMPHHGRNPNSALARFLVDLEALQRGCRASTVSIPPRARVHHPTVLRAANPSR